MGNWPSISRVVRVIDPASKTAWFVSSVIAASLDPLGGEDPAQLAQRPRRDVGLDLAAELAPPARSASPPAGRSRWRPSSSPFPRRRRRRRSAPGACRRARRRGRPGRCSPPAPRPGSSGPARLRPRQLREVLGRQHPQVEARAAAADLDVALGLARLDLHASSASERATSASSRPGRRTEPPPSTSASSVGPQAEVEVGGGERHRALAGLEEDAGERLGRGAGRDRPGDGRELGDEFFAFGRELQVIECLLELG